MRKSISYFNIIVNTVWSIVSALFILLCSPLSADFPPETNGLKYIRNFSRKDYNNQNQNWGILQDRRGMIYAANHGGLMEYDGVSWREIAIPNSTVRSLAVDEDNTVYIGGVNEFGILAPSEWGTSRYTSLSDLLEEAHRGFSQVWRTYAVKNGVYFCTSRYLFFCEKKSNRGSSKHDRILCRFETKTSFSAPFLCGGTIYVRENGRGLLQLKNNSLQLVPGGETFARTPVYMIVEYSPGILLIGSGTSKFSLYHRGKFTPFLTEAADYITVHRLSGGIRLSTGDFAIATRSGGIVVIDSPGKCKHLFDKRSGLPDDNVKYVYEDVRGNLWVCLEEGISKIEYASPVTVYDRRTGLPGNVLSATLHAGKFYAGTTRGLFTLVPPSNFPPRETFRPVNGINGSCWSLLSTPNGLLAATRSGVFQIGQGTVKKILPHLTFVLHRSSKTPERVWCGTYRGLFSLNLHPNGQWENEHRVSNIKHQIRTIVEDKNGGLWLGTLTKGVFNIRVPLSTANGTPGINVYDTSRGLPPGEVRVFYAAGHIMFATRKGIFRLHPQKQSVVPDATYGPELAGGPDGWGVFRIREDNREYNNLTWIHSRSRTLQAVLLPGGKYEIRTAPYKLVSKAQVNFIYPYPGGRAVMLAGADGLVRLDTEILQKETPRPNFYTIIREVRVNGTPLLYHSGKLKYKEVKSDIPVEQGHVFLYKDRNIRFQFAAPFFLGQREILYQCFLEGNDRRWSPWTSETRKDYTNLSPGRHTFRVRAKNVYGRSSSEPRFHFTILAPWYATGWAIAAYSLTAVLFIYLVARWRSRKLEKEKQKLERIIIHRTSKINRQKQQLQEQAEKLKEMDCVKSRFFTNISHEFRTPLTLIMGPLEQMIDQSPNRPEEHKFKMMLRNSQRLLGLIDQLLELSRFDSGKIKLQAAPREIVGFVRGITVSFAALAAQRELDLNFRTENDNITVFFDTGKMEEVLVNLLSNALDFTPPGGQVTVTVKHTDNAGELNKKFPSGWIEISVSDTGPGIPSEQLSHIFDRFYQSPEIPRYHQTGSGIGLAIAREIVELHRGAIEARTRVGQTSGAVFIVSLPLGNRHLKPGEIVGTFNNRPGEIGELRSIPESYQSDIQEEPLPASEMQKDIILVIEDNADMREYIRNSLVPDYAVITAANGKDGLEKAGAVIPDLVISDIMMPHTDGFQLCRQIKEKRDTSHIPVILLTAKASQDCIVRGLETGADDYITKPFNTRMLLARIKNLIDLRRHWQQTVHREMTLRPAHMQVSPVDREFLNQLKKTIEANMQDPDFNVNLLRQKMIMSRTSLYRKTLALTGFTPTEFIRTYRLKRGAELLQAGFGTVLEVALEVGFSSANYFTKCFKKKFQQLPTAYRQFKPGDR